MDKTDIDEITNKVKKAFALMHGHIAVNCLNDYFIMDKEFTFSKGDYKIMREQIDDDFDVMIPYVKFDNASINDIVNIIVKKTRRI